MRPTVRTTPASSQGDAQIRITDHFNAVAPGGGTDAATVIDIPFPVITSCAATASTAIGSTCAVNTTANAVGARARQGRQAGDRRDRPDPGHRRRPRRCRGHRRPTRCSACRASSSRSRGLVRPRANQAGGRQEPPPGLCLRLTRRRIRGIRTPLTGKQGGRDGEPGRASQTHQRATAGRTSASARCSTYGEETSCIELSEVGQLAEELDLPDSAVEDLLDQIEARGIELKDDCGREVAEQVTYANDALAAVTTDALQLFLREVNRFDLLTAAQEVDLAKRIERGDRHAKAHDGQREPAPRDLHRAPLPGQPAHPARPDPGGDPGIDPGDREVRLATWLQVLDLCDLVDPAGRRTRHRERGANDQAPRVRRRAGEEDRSRAAPADHGPRPPADRGGDRSRPPRCRSRRCATIQAAARTVTSLDKPLGEQEDTSLGDVLESADTAPAEEVELSLTGGSGAQGARRAARRPAARCSRCATASPTKASRARSSRSWSSSGSRATRSAGSRRTVWHGWHARGRSRRCRSRSRASRRSRHRHPAASLLGPERAPGLRR